MKKSHSIWWMNPAYLFLILMSVVIAGGYLIPGESYLAFYRVNKFINDSNIWYSILPAVCFIVGSAAASLMTRGSGTSHGFHDMLQHQEGYIKGWIKLLFGLTLFGYAIWFLIMIQNGFSLQLFLNVVRGEPGAIYAITENFKTITGITSFTNFGIPFVIFAVYYQVSNGKRTFNLMIAVVLVLTLIRAVFFSERLALMEILLPTLIIILAVKRKQGKKLPLVNYYPFIGVIALIGFFGLSEYFRSWLSFYVNIYPSFWEFIVTRFFGYYVTALNTGTLYVEQLGLQSIPFPYFTFEWIWKFPGLSDHAYFSAFGVNPEAGINNTLESMGNPEFNNPSGLLLPYQDYSLIEALMFWILLGYASGLLYDGFKKGRTLGLIMYPIWMVGILEIPRYLYFSSGRFFPCWIMLITFTLMLHYNRKKIISWQPAGRSGTT
ncbi:oligosaccharide repeat unit polymerase [Paenibacillus lemnae]|uniref:Oligosaccharide repeat unit polymerase n=1 Tax=Paenibacillus lemnae TaxID=1330551 RepID=A0A848MAG2_PAELE|nr:oligosaccharide repeat unit polymerase [Paenibacillus lemnae]NMO97556.1 oligosaccharide repeat unit polymerase [Paenibacillus lemnae]